MNKNTRKLIETWKKKSCCKDHPKNSCTLSTSKARQNLGDFVDYFRNYISQLKNQLRSPGAPFSKNRQGDVSLGKGPFFNLWLPLTGFQNQKISSYKRLIFFLFATFFQKSWENFGFWLWKGPKKNKSCQKSKSFKGPFPATPGGTPLLASWLSRSVSPGVKVYISYTFLKSHHSFFMWYETGCSRKKKVMKI